MVYKYRTIEYSVPAQQVGERIEELDKIHGEVTSQILVDDARPEGALMHPLYEWRDDVAAEKYRLNQARKLMSELVVVNVNVQEDRPPQPVRGFVSIQQRNETARYRPVVVAMSDKDMRDQFLANARAELASMDRKYAGLIDFPKLLMEYLNAYEK